MKRNLGPLTASRTFQGPPLNLNPTGHNDSILRPVEWPFKLWLWLVSIIHLAWLFTTPGNMAVFGVALIFILVPALIALAGLGNRIWAFFVCAGTTTFLGWTVIDSLPY